MPRNAQRLPSARAFTRRALDRWSYQRQVDDVVLVVSELLTNALLHGEGAPVLRLTVSPAWVRVEVSDESPRLPRLREPGSDGGWGMRMVEELGADWGSRVDGRGKVVWCELVSEPSAAAIR